MEEKILVLDFGGQYNQLIARRVREQQVYAEIKPYNKITLEEIRQEKYTGIIFTGGPNSVYDPKSPHYDPEILNLGIPVLGICYGAQLMAYMAGGVVSSAEKSSEYGKTIFRAKASRLFKDVPEEERPYFVLAAYNSGIGHIQDAMALAGKYGKDKHVWKDNVEKYLMLKSHEEYFNDSVCKFGYFRGVETYDLVKETIERFEQYKKKIAQ